MTKGKSSKRKRGKSWPSRQAQHEDQIFIRNIPTSVRFSVVTQEIASYVAGCLFPHLSVRVLVHLAPGGVEECGSITLQDDGSALARIRLSPQGGGGKAHCRGYGFLTLVPPGALSYEEAAAALNAYAQITPLLIEGTNGSAKSATLLFFYGEEGEGAEDVLRAKGRAKVDQSIEEAGRKLLELVRSKGGKMHVNDWSKDDRAIVNEIGKRRVIKPAVAAKASGGVNWDGQKAIFTLKEGFSIDRSGSEVE